MYNDNSVLNVLLWNKLYLKQKGYTWSFGEYIINLCTAVIWLKYCQYGVKHFLSIDQSIILWRSDLKKVYPSPYDEKKKCLALIKAIGSLLLENLTFGVIIGVVTSFATTFLNTPCLPHTKQKFHLKNSSHHSRIIYGVEIYIANISRPEKKNEWFLNQQFDKGGGG